MSRTGQSRLLRAVQAGVTIGTLVLVIAAQAGVASAAPLGTPIGAPVVDSYAGGSSGGQFRAPVVSWTPVANATKYEIQVSPDSRFSDKPLLDTSTSSLRLALPQELPHASYWWRVRALAGSAMGLWSSALGPFGRSWTDSPGGLTDNGGARLSWNQVAGASFYQVQVSRTRWRDDLAPLQTFKPGTTDCFTDHTTLTPFVGHVVTATDETAAVAGGCFDASQLDPGTNYFWRVRAWDSDAEPALDDGSTRCLGAPYIELSGSMTANTHVPKKSGECSYWSTTSSFTTPGARVAGAPATPTLVAPLGCPLVSGVATCPDSPTLAWVADPHADFYIVMLSLDCDACNTSGVTNIIRGWTTTYNSFTAPESLPDNDAQNGYHYYVQACVVVSPTSTACTDPQTPVGHFRIQHPAGPALLAGTPLGSHLAGGQQVVTAPDVTIQWASPSYSAATYTVEVAVDADTDFTHPLTLTGVNAPEATFTGIPDGLFRYRVTALDSSGLLRTTSVGTFQLDSTAPMASLPQDVLPLAGDVQIRLSKGTTAVSGSTLGLAVEGSSAMLPGTLSGTSITDLYLFTPSSPLVAGLGYHVVISPSVTDEFGNPAQASPVIHRGNPFVDDRSAALRVLSGTWNTGTSSRAVGGTFAYSATNHATLRTVVYGKQVAVYGCKTPNSGMVDVAVSGQRTVRVNLYQSYTSCGIVVFSGPVGSVAQRTVTLTNSGTWSSVSAGRDISIDGIRVR